jgi:AcrR family transcriptional regulator
MVKPHTKMKNKKDAESRKEQILEAALICFNKSGYYLTSIDNIAAKAKISKGGVYYHFVSKEKLFLELFDFKVNQYFEQLTAYIKGEKDPAEQLRVLAKKSGQILKENQAFFKFCLEFLSMGVREPGIRKGMTHFYKKTVQHFTVLITEGIDTGRFKPMSAEKIARAMYLLIMGAFFTYFSTDVDFDLIDQEVFNVEALLKGIQTQ